MLKCSWRERLRFICEAFNVILSSWQWKVHVNVAQLCLTVCDPVVYSLPGSSVHGILQVRILEWVAIPFSRGSSDPGIEPRSPALRQMLYHLSH